MTKVSKVDNQRSEDNKSEIFLHSFVLIIVGAVASGKTSLLVNMFTKTEFYKQKFHRIIFVLSTADLGRKIIDSPDVCMSNQKLQDRTDDDYIQLDESHQRTILPKFHGIDTEDVHLHYTPKILHDLVNEQKYIIREYGKEYSNRCCVIFDDAVTSGIYQGKLSDFAKFATSLRHVNCSLIHMNQGFKSSNKIVRSQSTGGVFFATNELELRDIFEVFSCGYALHKWLEIFSIVTNKAFNPIVFNLHNKRGYRIHEGVGGEFCG